MPEKPVPQPPDDAVLRTRLDQLTQLLRQADHLGPEAQETLADLVDELSEKPDLNSLTPDDRQYLIDTIDDLTEALHDEEHPGPLKAAQQKMQRALVQAEADAPTAAGFIERLLDALSSIGI